MKKKYLICIICLIFLCGCTNLKNEEIDKIVSISINNASKYKNVYRRGYNYYLPKGLKVVDGKGSNDIITDNKSNYYLYVDCISYLNEIPISKINGEGLYYYQNYQADDKKGYIKIAKKENNQYLIEIFYNYAKIEVIVDENGLNNSIAYSMSILSSVKYNKKVISKLISEEVTDFKEEEFDMFKDVKKEGNVLQYKEEYTEEEDYLPDTDLIN